MVLYKVVEFEDSQVSIVLSDWLNETGTEVYWPRPSQYWKALAGAYKPDLKTWTVYAITRTFKTTSEYIQIAYSAYKYVILKIKITIKYVE